MNRLKLMAACLFVIMGISGQTSVAVAKDWDIVAIVYEDSDFKGAAQVLSVGTYNIKALEFPNDSISSIKVKKGYIVTLYDDSNFDGKKLVLEGEKEIPSLGAHNFGDITSSITVNKY